MSEDFKNYNITHTHTKFAHTEQREKRLLLKQLACFSPTRSVTKGACSPIQPLLARATLRVVTTALHSSNYTCTSVWVWQWDRNVAAYFPNLKFYNLGFIIPQPHVKVADAWGGRHLFEGYGTYGWNQSNNIGQECLIWFIRLQRRFRYL